MNWRTLLSTVLLVAAAAASWLLVNQPLPESLAPGNSTTTTPAEIGYYARHATVVGTQKDGSRLYELNAREITHYPHDNSVVLRHVDLSYHAETDVPWTLQSEVGRLSETGDEIQLSGNVRVVSHPESEADRIIVTTTKLTIRPEENLALTDEPVRIQLGRHTLAGTGMKAYLKEERLELQSNVYGRFTP